MVHKILAVSVTVLLLLSCVITVSAEDFDPERTGSISVTLLEQFEKTPIVGAELSVYCIATVGINTDGLLNYIYLEGYDEIGIDLEDPDFVAKMDAFLSQNDMPAIKLYTDAQGTAVCTEIPLGLYFIRQTGAVAGYALCTPFLVTVPMVEEAGYVYDVNASPKTEVAKLTTITIKKVWNTDASAAATDSVTIHLLRDDQIIATAVLNKENNWQVTYTDMPESDAYSIEEVDVPEGFTVTYDQRGYVFTATNTASLIQTGQLIWPIPVLAISGMLMIGVGVGVLQKKRNANA